MNAYRAAVQNDYKINVHYSDLINELKIGILEREIKQEQEIYCYYQNCRG